MKTIETISDLLTNKLNCKADKLRVADLISWIPRVRNSGLSFSVFLLGLADLERAHKLDMTLKGSLNPTFLKKKIRII